jgi:hypothetical protein
MQYWAVGVAAQSSRPPLTLKGRGRGDTGALTGTVSGEP